MGITGLIPFLDKATTKTNLSKLPRNSTAAIDTYCWLHKGAFACADQLVRGETTDIHIKYCLKYVALLQSHRIRPILVFDGRHLPAKAGTEARRRESRATARNRAAELMRLGRTDEARQQLRRCVDITHRMALQLIQQCRQLGIDCIVAPYEADAQLAYLNRSGLADYVITEDSDLVLFGCTRILFKLDLAGQCLLLDATQLPAAMGCPASRYTFRAFRFMCIMSGCDYVDSLPGIGLGKACKFVLKSAEVGEGGAVGIRRTLSKIPAYLNMRQLEVSADYEAAFLRAAATFQHMVVYDPRRRKLVRLSDPEPVAAEELEWLGNAGEFFDEGLAWQLALGNVDPMSLERLDAWSPDEQGEEERKVRKGRSIWERQGDRNMPPPLMKSPQATVEEQLANSRPSIRFRDSPRKGPEPETDADAPEDLLAVYTKTRMGQQSVRAGHLHDPLERSPNLSRNPFGRQLAQTPPEALKSPTKICAANSSLLRQCSPVKRVEFERSPLKRLADRVKRTMVDGKQKVLSRFFAANRREAEVEKEKRPAGPNAAEMEEQLRLAQQKGALFYRAAAVEETKDAETKTSKRNADDEADQEKEEVVEHGLPPAKKTCRTLFAEEAQTTSSTQSSATTIDLTQSVEDEDAPSSSSSSSQRSGELRPLAQSLGRRKTTTATTCRQPGQSRKSAAAKGKSMADRTQSRLSAFGFSKKSL